LNLNLTKKDGIELLKIIKRDEILKIIPVIMLIDSSYEKYIIDSYKNCANAVLIKPDDFDGFEELILSLEDFWINKTKLPEF
jgi:DNA-binding response OmpR family regulator